MPLSALVAGRVLCMHGGISPDLSSFDQIRNLQRPLVGVPDAGIVADLLWADPDRNVTGKRLIVSCFDNGECKPTSFQVTRRAAAASRTFLDPMR